MTQRARTAWETQSAAIRGVHVSFSSLKNLANSNAYSLTKVLPVLP